MDIRVIVLASIHFTEGLVSRIPWVGKGIASLIHSNEEWIADQVMALLEKFGDTTPTREQILSAMEKPQKFGAGVGTVHVDFSSCPCPPDQKEAA
jgi:hypothetical protein